MTNQPQAYNHIIAVDVGKKHLEVLIQPDARRLTIANQRAAIAKLLDRERRTNQSRDLGPMLVICEATGGYELDLLDQADARSIACHRAHGRRVRDFARAMGRNAKTDAIDTDLLARFAQKSDNLTLYKTPSPAQKHLTQLVTRRSQILDMRVAEMNRLEHARVPRVHKSIRRQIAWLGEEKQAIDKEIKATIKADSELAHKAKLLNSFKGVGPATIATLLAYLPELGELSKGEVAAITGLAPFNNDSAKSNKPRHIHAGRGQVRSCLYMAALVAMRHNPTIKAFFQRLTQNAKTFKVAMTAAMRKIITILNAIIKSDQPWKHAKTA